MLDFSRVQSYYITCGYTDMRKQIDGLATLVQTQFGQKMGETSFYWFCGRRADRIKALYWDGTGLYPAVQAPDGETVPMAAKRKRAQKAHAAGISLGNDRLSITHTKTFVPGKPGTIC